MRETKVGSECEGRTYRNNHVSYEHSKHIRRKITSCIVKTEKTRVMYCVLMLPLYETLNLLKTFEKNILGNCFWTVGSSQNLLK